MSSRARWVIGSGLVVAVAAATTLIILYENGQKESGAFGADLVSVIVSKEDIPAGACLDPLIEMGLFHEIRIPTYALVEGGTPTVDHLRGTVAHVRILADEQISSIRLTSERAWEANPSAGACLRFSSIEQLGR